MKELKRTKHNEDGVQGKGLRVGTMERQNSLRVKNRTDLRVKDRNCWLV